jgi:DNA-binding MarR family transcriptional regulator
MDIHKEAPHNLDTARTVRQAVMGFNRRMRAARTDEPLSASKLTSLGWLLRRGPMTPTDLAKLERIRPQSLTRLLAGLEADGLVERASGPADRRQSLVAITERGVSALSHDMRQRDAWIAAAMTQALSPTEIELLRLAAQLLERLADTDVAPNPTIGPNPTMGKEP